MSQRFVLSLVVVILLLPALLPAGVLAEDEAQAVTPEDVVEMILSDDEARRDHAAALLEAAPPAWVDAFAEALRARVNRDSPLNRGTPPGPTTEARRQVLVTTEIWTLPRTFLKDVFGTSRESAFHYLDDLDREVVLRGIAKRDDGTRTEGPRLVVETGQEGRLEVMSEVHYVREYTVERAQGAVLAEPVIDTVLEGFRVSALPTLADDGLHVTLELAVGCHVVKRPIPRREVVIEGLDEPVLIDVPEVRAQECRATLRIEDGMSIAFSGFPDPEHADRERVFVLQAHVLEEAPEVLADRQVLLTIEYWRLPEALLEDIGLKREGSLCYLDDTQLALVRRGIEKTEGATRTGGHRIVALDGEEASFEVMGDVPYVRDFAVDRSVEPAVARKILGTMEEELAYVTTPVVSEDGAFITLDMHVTSNLVKRPMRKKTVRLEGVAQPVEVETPVLHASESRMTITLPADGGTAAMTGFTPSDASEPTFFVVFSAHVMVPDPFEPPPFVTEEQAAEATHAILVEAQVLQAEESVARKALGDAMPDAGKPVLVLDARQVVALLGAEREGAPGVSVLHAPSIMTYDGQRANVSILNQLSYLSDYEVEKTEAGVSIVNPVVQTIQEGLVLEITPSVTEDKKALHLETFATLAAISRPIPEFEAELEGQTVTIQIPELRVLRIREEIRLPAGGYALLALGKSEEGKRRFVLLHASVVTLR